MAEAGAALVTRDHVEGAALPLISKPLRAHRLGGSVRLEAEAAIANRERGKQSTAIYPHWR